MEKGLSVKLLRLNAKMTQQQLSEFIGCSKRNIENWEQGVSVCPEYVRNLIKYKLTKEGVIKDESD